MNLKRVQELLRLMEEHDLAEIEVEDKDTKIRLRKREQGVAVSAPAAAAAPEAGQAAPGVEAEPSEGTDVYTIISPIVGTFYRAPAPDDEHFVEVGDPVDSDTVVCIVEAMKVMNEVKADVTGSILRALAENGKPVEYGQPLFLVSRQ